MERSELTELHYITPICNVQSIMQNGVLSHMGAARYPHESVAMQEIQDRRARKSVPGGRPLHEYVNLYVCGRNPMLFKRLDQHERICVLSVSTDVLDLTGAVVTDQNAASDYARFAKAPSGLTIVNREMAFAEVWKHPENQILEWQHTSIKCAEVLVPNLVEPRFIRGAYVSCDKAKTDLEDLDPRLTVTVDRKLFFDVR